MTDPNDPRYIRAREHVDRLSAFYKSLGGFVVVGVVLFIINLVTGRPWWFFWPLIFWAIGLVFQAYRTFGPSAALGDEWEQRKIQEYMDKDQR